MLRFVALFIVLACAELISYGSATTPPFHTPAEWFGQTFIASDRTNNDEFGGGATFISKDHMHIVVCASRHTFKTGKCYVFSQSVAGAMDWHSNERSMFPVGGIPDDYMAEFSWSGDGPLMTSDNQNIIACSAYADDRAGKCWIFSESTPGARDWNDTQTFLTNGAERGSNQYFSYGGPVISSNDEYIAVCAHGVSSGGKCYIFMESTPGAKDWDTNGHHALSSITGDQIGVKTVAFTPDNKFIMTCATAALGGKGACFVYIESAPGMRDWNLTTTVVSAVDGITSDSFGSSGPVLSQDSNHLLTCVSRYHSPRSRCYVLTRSSDIAYDWNDTQSILIPPNNAPEDDLAYNGALISYDSEHVLACAHENNNKRGTCYIWSQSTLGSHDWHDNLHVLNASDAEDQDTLGYYRPFMTNDTRIVVCSDRATTFQGACYLFEESSPGARDWQDNQIKLSAGYWYDVLGNRGGAHLFREGNYSHVVSCAHGSDYDKGRCWIFSDYCNDYHQCANNATCVPVSTGYECDCTPESGKTGDFCTQEIDDCDCANGICTDLTNNYTCNCSETGFYGYRCDLDIDDCASNPCSMGSCIDTGLVPYTFTCNCDSGYTGELCDVDIDDCMPSLCENNSTCSDDGSIPNAFNCSCLSGYTGVLCNEDIDDCVSDPCENGGTCFDDGSEPNSFLCGCLNAFVGDLCELDFDDCSSSPCVMGNCSDNGSVSSSFNCSCDIGYNGTLCDEDVNDCVSDPCQNNATCSDDGSVPNAFNCTCLPGFVGTLCDVDYDECSSSPCYAEGTSGCFNLAPSLYECKCLDGYSGEFCEIADVVIPSACDSTPCLNEGICVDLGNSMFECDCSQTLNYTGLFCELFMSAPTSNTYQIQVSFILNGNRTVEDYLLDELLEAIPGSYPEQFEIQVVVLDDDMYEVTIWSKSTTEASTADIDREINAFDGWAETDAVEEEEEPEDDGIVGMVREWMIYAVGGLLVITLLLLGLFCMRKRKADTKKVFNLPA